MADVITRLNDVNDDVDVDVDVEKSETSRQRLEERAVLLD